MKKWTLLLLSLLLAFGTLDAQNKGNKMKIAVMDFKAGVGVEEREVQGLSDMLINTLFETKKFDIVERSQLHEVFKEQKLQGDLTVQQCVQVGRILGVKSVLIGTVNFLAEHKNNDGSYSGEYNVDVRAVDVESGEVVTTAGATKSSGSTYRAMMEKIGHQLAANLMEEEPGPSEVLEEPKPKKESFRKTGFAIRPELGFVYGYKDRGYNSYVKMFGPIADVAIGYQLGSHFFLGAVVGYGGEYRHREYNYYIHHIEDGWYDRDDAFSLIPLTADVRWYIINHKNTFVVDFQGGWTLGSSGFPVIKSGAGFAFGNFEVTAGAQWIVFDITGFHINASYRFGTNTRFKDLKWW